MKSKSAAYKMLELNIAAFLGGLLSYFLTKLYDTNDIRYFYVFCGALVFSAVFCYIFYRSIPDDKK